eukprot:6374587-Karenia_brevis.AAC.1
MMKKKVNVTSAGVVYQEFVDIREPKVAQGGRSILLFSEGRKCDTCQSNQASRNSQEFCAAFNGLDTFDRAGGQDDMSSQRTTSNDDDDDNDDDDNDDDDGG